MYRDEQQRDFARQMRKQLTDAERRLWNVLRARQLNVKFRRQAAIGPYIADFVCFSHQLIVGLDGPQHVEARGKLHDERHTGWLAACGFRVIQFRNQALDECVWSVVEGIQRVLREQSEAPGTPLPSPPRKGERVKQVARGRCAQGDGAEREQLHVGVRGSQGPAITPSSQ